MPNPSFSYPLSQPYIVSKVGSRMNSVPAPRLVLAKLGLSHSASDLHKLLEKVLPHLQKISKHRSDFLNVGFECRKYRAGWKKWMVKTVEPFWSYQSSWKMDLHPTKKMVYLQRVFIQLHLGDNFGLVRRTLTLLRNEL